MAWLHCHAIYLRAGAIKFKVYIRQICCAYEALRCLDVKIWWFFVDDDNETDYYILVHACGLIIGCKHTMVSPPSSLSTCSSIVSLTYTCTCLVSNFTFFVISRIHFSDVKQLLNSREWAEQTVICSISTCVCTLFHLIQTAVLYTHCNVWPALRKGTTRDNRLIFSMS